MRNSRNFLLLLLFAITFMSCASKEESTVKNGSFKACENNKVGELIDSFVEDAKWETIVASDNNTYVNVKGKILMYNSPANVLIQFRVDGESFEIYSVEINGEGQNVFLKAALVEKMCENLNNSK